MKYGLKITRDTTTGKVTIHAVQQLPPGMEPYRLRHPELHVAESLRVFTTKKAAEHAAELEREVLRLAEYPPEELAAILRNRKTRLREALGTSAVPVWRHLAGVKLDVLDSYTIGRLNPNPRTVARLRIAADMLLDFAESVESELPPPEAPAGNPRMSRGGRPELPYIRRVHPAKRKPAP